MKKSRLMILLLVVMIFTLSAVSAADLNDTSDSVIQNADDNPIEELESSNIEEISSSEENNVLADAGDKNFTVLQDEIDNAVGIVFVDSDYVRVAEEEDIVISQSITLIGDDIHKIDANNLGGIFKINSGVILTLNNVILVNGNNENGGAIYNEGTVNIISSNLNDNTATVGGAVYNKGILSVSGSTFDGNKAANYGGAVYSEGTLVVGESTFRNNDLSVHHTTGEYGGYAIWNTENARELQISESTFADNGASYQDGDKVFGAVASMSSATIKNSIFNNNAGRWGGAIGSYGYSTGTLTISGSKFNGNKAYQGGAVFSQKRKLVVSNSEFTANEAVDGGAIDHDAQRLSGYDAEITNSLFDSNKATGLGSAIRALSGFRYDACNFTNNQANGGTTTIHYCTNTRGTTDGLGDGNYEDSVITNSRFEGNSGSWYGSVYYYGTKSLTISKSEFKSNSAGATGVSSGAITFYGNTLTVTDSNFTQNEGKVNGSAIAIWGGQASIAGSRFEGNTVNGKPNSVYLLEGELALSGNTIVGSNAEIFVQNGEITSQIKVVILDNDTVSTYDGTYDITAKVTDDKDNLIANIDNFKFIANKIEISAVYDENDSLYHGNAILPAPGIYTINITYIDEEKLSIQTAVIKNFKGTFQDLQQKISDAENNKLDLEYNFTYAGELGDDVYIDGIVISNALTIDGKGYTINGSDAARIFKLDSGASLTLQNITLTNAYSNSNGGAVYVDAGSALNIKDAIFKDNAIDGAYGGAIYTLGATTVDNVTFINNTVKGSEEDSFGDNVNYGGAIATIGSALTIVDSTFTQNNAEDCDESYGGAIYVRTSTISITGSKFNKNTATDGGALHIIGSSSISIVGSDFIENTAITGGALTLYNIYQTATAIDGCTFTKNSAVQGGAIEYQASDYGFSNSKTGYLVIENSKFDENIALTTYGTNNAIGPAIVVSSEYADADITLKIINSNITNHDNYNGAITVDYTKLIIEQSKFIKNTAFAGAAIYAQKNSEVTITQSSFINNTVTGYGGAVYIESNAKLTVQDSDFINNNASDGGAIKVNGQAAVDDVRFKGNRATFGGAISSKGTLTIKNSLFKDNGADLANSILVNENGVLSLENNTINNQTADIVVADNAKITSYINATILGNDTVDFMTTNIKLTAKIVDDEGNLINATGFKFKVEGISDPIDAAYKGGLYEGMLEIPSIPNVYPVDVTYSQDIDTYIGIVRYVKGTFTQLQRLIDNAGDELNLTTNFTYDKEIDGDNFPNGIVIDHKITINGNGYMINGSGLNRIFKIDVPVVLNNITFADGFSDDAANGGGALYISDSALIKNSNFINNTASAGGAIYFDGVNLTIENTEFRDNVALENGGAIYASCKNMTISDSLFVNDTSKVGGAIYFDGELLTIKSNSIFKNNTASVSAGAISVNGDMVIEDSKFIENKANKFAGAISVNDGDLTISNTVLSKNKAIEEYAGAIYLNNGDLMVIASNFTNNIAFTDAGAISFGGSGTLTIKSNSTFKDNTGEKGGAIKIDNSNAVVEDSEFINNIAVYDGGAIYVSGSENLKITGSTFNGNQNSGFNDPSAGAISFTSTGTLTVDDSEFIENIGGWVGAIYIAIGSTADISNSRFSANNGDNYISIANYGTLTLKNNTINTQKAEIFSAATGKITSKINITILENKTVDFIDNVLVVAKVTDDNGNLITDMGLKFVIGGVEADASHNDTSYYVTYNQPAIGIYVATMTYSNEDNLVINKATLRNIKGTFTQLQNLIDEAEDELDLNDDFTFNADIDAEYIGGVKVNKTLTINGTNHKISGNELARIFEVSSDATIKNINFIDGYAKTMSAIPMIVTGGAIQVGRNLGNVLIENCNFTNNKALSSGGAIYTLSKVTIKDSNFTDNVGGFNAGAIHLYGGDGSSIINSIFVQNKASGSGASGRGGAIYVNAKQVTISDSNFTSNIANTDAGAIFFESSATGAIVTGSNFTGNKANKYVGAIYASAKITISDSNFTDNKALLNGAVFFSSNSKGSVLKDCNFDSADDEGYDISNAGNITLERNNVSGKIINKLGILSLNKNNVEGVIYNTGNITSKVNITVLSNKTIDTIEDTYAINATIVDDNGNWIYDEKVKFTVNDVEVDAAYNDATGLYTATADIPETGIYNISMTRYDEKYINIGIIRNIKGTFTDLQNKIAKAIEDSTDLDLEYNFTYVSEIDGDALKDGVVISAGLTIDGNDYVINGTNHARIFKVLNNVDLTLNDLIICNANVTGEGGAISISYDSKLTVDNVIFENNTAFYGGAISAVGSRTEIVVKDSKFINNTADVGGAINIARQDCKLEVTGSYFAFNKATGSDSEAGAIYVQDIISLKLDYVDFINNTAESAGAVSITKYESSEIIEATINNTNFINNTATKSAGGAIFTYSNPVIIENAKFENNTAVVGNGGAIFLNGGADSLSTIKNAEFNSNIAGGQGGAIVVSTGTANITADFNGNGAGAGEAVYVRANGISNFKDSVFTQNGGINNYSIYNLGTLTLNETTVDNLVFSNGKFDTILNATILNNKTWNNTGVGDIFILNATLIDANGNRIYDPDFRFTVDGTQIDDVPLYNNETGVYNLAFYIKTAGLKVISTSYVAENLEIFTGALEIPLANVTEFIVKVEDIDEGDNATIFITLIGVDNIALNETVQVIINNQVITIDVTDGKGNKTIENLTHGSYPVVAQFNTNPNYNPIINSTVFYVKQTTASLKVMFGDNYEYLSPITIAVSLTNADDEGITGVVYVTVDDGDAIPVAVVDGEGVFTVTGLSAGEHTLLAEFLGDKEYNATKIENETFTVNPKYVYVDVRNDNGVNIGEEGRIKVYIEDQDGNNIIDDVELIFTDNDGNELERINITTSNNPFGMDGSVDLEFTKDWSVGMYYVTVESKNFVFMNFTDEESFVYEFISYGDAEGNIEYATGTVEVIGEAENGLIPVKVLTNDIDDSFVDKVYYIQEDAKTDGTIYQLYDEDGNPVDIYVKVSEAQPSIWNPVTVEYPVHKKYINAVVTQGEGEYIYRNEHIVAIELAQNYEDGNYDLVEITCPATVVVLKYDDEQNEFIVVDTIATKFENGILSINLTELETGEYRLKVNITSDMYELHSESSEEIDVDYVLFYNDDNLFWVNEDNIYLENIEGTQWTQYGDERIFTFELWHSYWSGDEEIIEIFSHSTLANVTVYKVERDDDGNIQSLTPVYTNDSVSIIDGISQSIDLSKLNASEYKVTVELVDSYYHINGWEDDHYADYYAEYFTTDKADVEVSVNVDSITYGEKVNVTVTITTPIGEKLNETVEICISGFDNIEVTLANGTNKSTIPYDLNVGNYTIWVNFLGTDNYWSSYSNIQTFSVEKATPTFDVNDTSAEWNTPFDIPVKLVGANGEPIVGKVIVTVSWEVDAIEKVVTLNSTGEGIAQFVIDEALGDLTITASFAGNDNYKGVEKTAALTITESTVAKLVVVAESQVSYNETAHVNVTLINARDVVIGNAIVTYTVDNGEAKTARVDENGFISIPIEGLNGGKHIITVSFNNESYSTSPSETVNITVNPIDPIFTSDVSENNFVGSNVTITVKAPKDATGNVSLMVDGEIVSTGLALDEGIVQFNVTDLGAGHHSYLVTYEGDANYKLANDINSFDVAKIDPEIIIEDISGKVGDAVDVTVTITGGDATGHIIFNDVVYNVKNGQTTIPVFLSKAGMQSIALIYSGNDKYSNGTGNKGFNVAKADTTITVLDELNTTYGKDVEIEFSISPEVDEGNVTVSIGGNLYYNGEIGQTTGSVKILSSYLDAAKVYTISVQYIGDVNYNNSNIANLTLNVGQADSKVTITPILDVDYGTSPIAVEYIIVNETDFVTISVTDADDNDIEYSVQDGKIIISDVIAAGKYTVSVHNGESDSYKGSEANITFNVLRIAPTMKTIITPDIIVGDEGIKINITLPENADGSVSVSIDGQIISIGGKPTNGNLSINVPANKLNAGNHTYYVIFGGDTNYTESSDLKTFEVAKADTALTIKVEEESIGVMGSPMVNITLSVETDGYVQLDNSGIVSVVKLEKGKYTFTITDLQTGNYYINATFLGNENYNSSNDYKEFSVSKTTTSLEITDATSEIKGGENATFTVSMDSDFANGNITVYVDGELAQTIVLDNDYANASVTVSGLQNGTHVIGVKYNGNGNYEATEIKNITVNVVKSTSSVTIDSVENVTFGNSVEIKYIIVNETDFVTISVTDENGEMVDFTVDNGVITIDNVLSVGKYLVNIHNGDDGIFDESEANITFYVVNGPTIDIDMPENTTIPTFAINLPEDATGYLLVDINGERYYAPVENGVASIDIPGLSAGNYTANITYTGDSKYPKMSKTAEVKIASNIPENALTIPETSETSSPVYSISLPSDAGGYFEVDVDGSKYVAALTNGSASVTVPELSEGSHNVTVKYSGDGKYTSFSKNTTITVHVPAPTPEPVYSIVNNAGVSAIYSAKASYSVRLTKNGSPVAGENVVFKFNGKTYTVATGSDGYARLNLATSIKVGKYTITAESHGKKVSNIVNIKHVIKASNKKIKKSKKVTKVKITLYKVNGKVLKSKTIKIKFRGKTYKVKTNKKGIATWKVKKSMVSKLKIGKKYSYKVTYGKDVLNKKITIKR